MTESRVTSHESRRKYDAIVVGGGHNGLVNAAYLARARWFNRAEDWPKALTAADRAIAIDPNAPEPYFNRALAYEGLDLTERAEAAWADYTARDRSSAWAREAQERKQALTR